MTTHPIAISPCYASDAIRFCQKLPDKPFCFDKKKLGCGEEFLNAFGV
jgi:hypothetical protein